VQVSSKVVRIFMFMSISENIKKLRKARGLTQAALGQKIGTRQKVIADYENGISKPPQDRLPVIAKFFGVSVDELIGTEDVIPPKAKDDEAHVHGNSRIAKLQEVFEKLPAADQRAVLKHINGLLADIERKNGKH
jgi:transcriptional regulator with XRE-family HTH domain